MMGPSLRSSWRVRAVAGLFLALFAFSFIPVLPSTGAATPPKPGAYALALSTVPPIIPADGLAHQALVVTLDNGSGLPTIATQSVKVVLSSANVGVVGVPDGATIPPGRSFVLVNVTTTSSPGRANVTAIAAGLRGGWVLLHTAIPSGYADHLAVYAVPAVQLARTSSGGELVIQAQDDLGAPAKTAAPVDILVSSSDNRTVQLPSHATAIPSRGSVVTAPYETGLTTGMAVITASAPGFASGSATIQVVRAPPLELLVTAEPSTIATGSQGRLVVSLLDQNGDPAEAPAPITVYLTSSNLSCVQIEGSTSLDPIQLVIPKNQVYVSTTFATLIRSSQDVIVTASAHGVASGFATISVAPSARVPTNLELFLAPNPVPSDGGTFSAVAVGMRGTGASPAVAEVDTPIIVTASDNATGKVLDKATVQMSPGQSYVVANFNSTLFPSTTTITASAQNLQPAQAVMTTLRPDLPIGPPPTRVVVTPVTPTVPEGSESYQALLVSLEASGGDPAVAPVNINVRLSLNTSDVIQLVATNNTVTVAANSSYTIVSVNTLDTTGGVNVTASAPGYGSTWTTIRTTGQTPERVALYVSPSISLGLKSGSQAFLAIQLQVADGSPAMTRGDTQVSLVSSPSDVFNGSLTITIPAKEDYALISLSQVPPGKYTISASSPGLAPGGVSFTSSGLKESYRLSPSAATVTASQSDAIFFSAIIAGSPIANATLSWSVTGGTLSNPSNTTNKLGAGSAIFTPSGVGLAQVTVEMSSPLTGVVNSSTSVFVQSPPPGPSALSTVMKYLPYIGGGAAAAIILVAVIFIRRRRGGDADEDEGFSIGDSPGPLGS